MSCITKGNVRCSKCCEVIHIDKDAGNQIMRGIGNWSGRDFIKEYWKPISKKLAKKLNPYIFEGAVNIDWVNKEAMFFKCTALVDGVCTQYKNRPQVCRSYDGKYNDYSPTCSTDINIIARSVG